MDNVQIIFAGWNNTKGHDKVWGYFRLSATEKYLNFHGETVYVFWGARGKSISIKQHEIGEKLYSLQRSKTSKDYKKISEEEFLKIFPNFYQQIDEKLTFAILAGAKYKAVE